MKYKKLLNVSVGIAIGLSLANIGSWQSLSHAEDTTTGASEGTGFSTEEYLALEDLDATGQIETTIDVDMLAEDWVEQASEKVEAVAGDTYIKLDRGVLTVDQMNWFLNSMPAELTFADENNQFLYYNYMLEANEMFASRTPDQVGGPLGVCHPEEVHGAVAWVINQLREGEEDLIRIHVPKDDDSVFVVHSYQRMEDEDGQYRGINEYVQDIMPYIEFYLKETGQKLVVDEEADTTSGATAEESSED